MAPLTRGEGTAPPPATALEWWTGQDVGETPTPGSSFYDAATDTFSLSGTGKGTGGPRDQVHFVHVPWSGDVEVIARVDVLAADHPPAEAGIAIRNGLNDDAPMAALCVRSGFAPELWLRTTVGGVAHRASNPVSPPMFSGGLWLRLTRVGDVVRASRSDDGDNWIPLGSGTIASAAECFVGLQVSGHHPAKPASAAFSQVTTAVPVFGRALLLVGDPSLNVLEQSIRTRMEEIGYDVQVATAAADPGIAAEASVVVVSDTADRLDDRWAAQPTPVMTWNPVAFAALGLTGADAGRDHGVSEHKQAVITITEPDHALAAGFHGAVPVARPASITWGRPAEGGAVVAWARVAGSDDQPVIFGFEVGAALMAGFAPARRAGLFLHADVADHLRDEGWTLFEAALAWAANVPPEVTVTVPPFGSIFPEGEPIMLQADASDADGRVVRVEFHVDGAKVGEATAPPYVARWSGAGSSIAMVTALAVDDRNGHAWSDPVAVIINAPPSIRLTSPLEGAVFQQAGSISLAVDASDADGAVDRVRLFSGGTLLSEIGTPPFSYTWPDAPPGHHTLRASAFDNHGLRADSPPVGIFVNRPPAVALTAPEAGELFSVVEPISWSATASDADGDVAKVEFFANGERIDGREGAPYSIVWADAPEGSLSLTAVATDDLGGSAASEPRVISVVADKDLDGLPDVWEWTHFPDLGAEPADDPDGDGLSNLREYQTGRDPLTPDADAVVLVDPAILLWLRGDRGTSEGDGEPIAIWVDQSGNGNNASAVDPTRRPLRRGEGIDDLPVVRFDGIDDRLAVDLRELAGANYSILAVSARSAGGAPAWLVGAAGGQGGGFALGYDESGRLTLKHRTGVLSVSASEPADPAFSLVAAEFHQATGHTLRRNGVSIASDANTGALGTLGAVFIGAEGDPGATFGGDIAELIIYRDVLDETSRGGVESYLAEKYGILLGAQPTPGDSDGDGLLDDWELQWFGDLDESGGADFDGDGATNREEMDAGSDPTDYYNGQLPGLAIVGGNNQSGLPGEFLVQPLTVQIIGAGGEPLVDAPVAFAVTGGAGGISRGFGGTTSNSLSLRTDAGGRAKVFFQVQTGEEGLTSLVEAAVGGGVAKRSVVFAAHVVDEFLDEDNLVVELDAGETTVRGITLYNSSAEPVNYTLTATQPDAPIEYVWRTSDDEGGPEYVWEDIRAAALWLAELSVSRDGSQAIDLGFPFPFYGELFSRVFLNVNGYLTFGQAHLATRAGDEFPSLHNPANIIAPLFTDLHPVSAGEIYFLDDGERAVFQFEGVEHFLGNRTTMTFQVILHRNGDILFVYKALAQSAQDAMVGMQNRDATKGVVVQGWQPMVKSKFAVLITPNTRWLTVSPAAGRVLPRERHTIIASFDAGELTGGSYASQLELRSDHPARPVVDLPARLIVNARPVPVITAPPRPVHRLAGQEITLTGSAVDPDGVVVSLEWFAGDTLLGETSPSSPSLTWTSSAVGEYGIRLRAIDSRGATGTSEPLTVHIDRDADGDGLGDEWETASFGDLAQEAVGDFDQDGLTNLDEYQQGLNPAQRDSDGDGLNDALERAAGLDPFAADAWDDPDGDGFPNGFEAVQGTDLWSAASVPSPDFIVDAAGGGTHTTIKGALNAATTDFQIIQVAPGRYAGAGNTDVTLARRLMLVSERGAAATLIDGEGARSGVGLAAESILRGFTISHCRDRRGGGLAVWGSGARWIDGCVIVDCSAESGGGVEVDLDGIAHFRHCTVVGNRSDDGEGLVAGSGIHVEAGHALLTNSICWNDPLSDILVTAGVVTGFHCNIREPIDGAGNIHETPRLTPDHHLRADSVLRGAGIILTGTGPDMDGESRPAGGPPDIGADQFLDTDADGLPDAWELQQFGSLAPEGSDDPDEDGLSHALEYASGTDPRAAGDADDDGLGDLEEVQVHGSNPTSGDSDGDGMPDKYEADHGLDPTSDDAYEDLDGDGYPNGYEYRGGSGASDPLSVPEPDFVVDPSGEAGAWTTIRAAVNATSRDFQIILVKPGVYRETVVLFRWKTLLIAEAGAAATIIDGEGVRRCVSISAESALVGFHLRNGGTARNEQGQGVNISTGRFNTNRTTVLQNCVFTDHRSSAGGAVSIFSFGRMEVFMRNCTLLNNHAAETGSGILVIGTAPDGVGLTITDSILWNHSAPEISSYQSRITIRDSIVRGGFDGVNVSAADPLLAPSGHLRAASPARDAGHRRLFRDMDGELQALGGAPDIGADEFIDIDEDSLPDWWELAHFGDLAAQIGEGDADGDGVSNVEEYHHGSHALHDDDADQDGIGDVDEIAIHGTNPALADTDADSIPDGLEIQVGLDPLRDDAMEDADGDGYPNIFEAMRGADPLSASSVPAADYRVAHTFPRTHATIRAALQAANGSGQNFRIVLVEPGTHSTAGQPVSITNQRTLLISAAGADQTVIDGGNVSYPLSGIAISSHSAVHGLTIRGMVNGFGALRLNSNARISNCIIRNNSATQGAAVYVAGGRATIVHSTILNNTALASGSGLVAGFYGAADLINCIFWNPGPATEVKLVGPVTVRRSIVRGGIFGQPAILHDPLLTSDGHLRFASPARGAGITGAFPALDLDGEVRPLDSTPDIGADQFSGAGAEDADEDAMLDVWETAHGLDPLKDDAYEDADGDGIANVYEASSDTDPQDVASVPSADLVVDGTPGAADAALGVHATLQGAIDALSRPHQIIEVRPGVYEGGVVIAGANARGVLIRSSEGAARTVIDGAGTSFGFAVSTDAAFSGLTIAHGVAGSGAGLSVDAARVNVTNCVFRDNLAEERGGAIWSGGGEVEVRHSTFYNNRVAAGGAGSGVAASDGAVQVSNSILWNEGEATDVDGSPATVISVRSSILRSGGQYIDDGGNSGADPLLSTRHGHLPTHSPARDAADPERAVAFDMEGDARPAGAGSDLGADEYIDSDGDGLNDGWEIATFGNLLAGPDDDADGDGLSNRQEFEAASDPLSADTDGDGLDDQVEVAVHRTNPNRADTDGDTIADALETALGLDPLEDDVDLDSDGDGLPNLLELEIGTRPDNKDTDGDGLLDGLEAPEGFDPLVHDYVGLDETPPSAPTGLQALEVTPASVTLGWNAVSDAGGAVRYEVWRNGRLIDRTMATTFIDEYGDPNVYAFEYQVTALDSAGNASSPSAIAEGSTAARFKPLPKDADGDGMLDADDPDPADPANAFRDDDGDAIANRDDPEPDVFNGPRPSVRILNNDDRVSYLRGETMRLAIRVSDPDATIMVRRNGSPLGEAWHREEDVFEFEWLDLPEGIHHLEAVIKDEKKATVATQTFLVDVAEREAHIMFVGPHPDGTFGRNYSIKTRLDGVEVDRPILRNVRSPIDGSPEDFSQGIGVHDERYYRGRSIVALYADGERVASFEIPEGENHPLVLLRETRTSRGDLVGVKPYLVEPSAPPPDEAMAKIANFSASPIVGGFTRHLFYSGVGGPDENDVEERIAAQRAAVDSAIHVPTTVLPGRIGDVPVQHEEGYMSFYGQGDFASRQRLHPEPPNEFPPDLEPQSPEWWAWYRKHGKIHYQYIALPPVRFAAGDRMLFCYYRDASSGRGIRWWRGLPLRPEMRLTPFNVGTVDYPGGRGHPANNGAPAAIRLPVNADFDDQLDRPDNADEVLGASDDDLVRVNVKIDLRGRSDATKIRVRLPTDEQGQPVLRGYYDSSGWTPVPGQTFTWSLAAHPALLAESGVDLYFEGLRPEPMARIEFDLLNEDDVPLNRVHPTQGDPEVLTLSVMPVARLLVDQNRDGVIAIDDSDETSPDDPFRFWINDDDDQGPMAGDDVPGRTDVAADFNGTSVGSVRDLVDFFPVYLDIANLLSTLSPTGSVKYKLKQADGALNFVYTNRVRAEAFGHHRTLSTTGFGAAFSQAAGVADKQRITATGVELALEFLNGIRNHGWGVILVEARVATAAPLVLAVERDDETVAHFELPIRMSPVEAMFRHVDLTGVATNYDGSTLTLPAAPRETDTSEPANLPNSETNGKYFVFLHGYNVDARNARGWQAEVFKRLHVLGSRARFVGVTWHGATGLDYHKAVFQAFQTGDALAEGLSFTEEADMTIAAHSLGNMVVSHAIQSAGLIPARYYMINAATPIEAYALADVGANQPGEMTELSWRNYDPRLHMANWHQLFEETDGRSKLTWKESFSTALPRAYNFFSEEEDVVSNEPDATTASVMATLLRQGFNFSTGAWKAQELVKGVDWTGSLVAALMERGQAGWGYNHTWNILDQSSGPPSQGGASTWRRRQPSETTEITSEELKTKPFFRGFINTLLISVEPLVASAKASEPSVRYDLWARAIPAMSNAVAANHLNSIDERNFNMPLMGRANGVLPTPSGKWRHSDFKVVALPFVFPMYDKMIVLGEPK